MRQLRTTLAFVPFVPFVIFVIFVRSKKTRKGGSHKGRKAAKTLLQRSRNALFRLPPKRFGPGLKSGCSRRRYLSAAGDGCIQVR